MENRELFLFHEILQNLLGEIRNDQVVVYSDLLHYPKMFSGYLPRGDLSYSQ